MSVRVLAAFLSWRARKRLGSESRWEGSRSSEVGVTVEDKALIHNPVNVFVWAFDVMCVHFAHERNGRQNGPRVGRSDLHSL